MNQLQIPLLFTVIMIALFLEIKNKSRKSDTSPTYGGACFDGAEVVNSVLADGDITFKGDITLEKDAILRQMLIMMVLVHL